MDMIKIGKFITECRKKQNLTQTELAEKLSITDRAVSKWECGKSMPDSSIMLELCEILKISVNELLTGEALEMTDYNLQAEKNLIEMKKQKEESDRRLLTMEILIGIVSVIFLTTLIIIGALIVHNDESKYWVFLILLGVGFIIFIICMCFVVRIEQKAGYYECNLCHHKYIPKYSQVMFAMHVNRTRYMKCPCCNKRSWQKKVLSNEDKKD